MFSESSHCLLGQHGSCSTVQRHVELSENILQNLYNIEASLPGFCVSGHTLEYGVVFLGHLFDLIGTEDIAKVDVAVVVVKLLLIGG